MIFKNVLLIIVLLISSVNLNAQVDYEEYKIYHQLSKLMIEVADSVDQKIERDPSLLKDDQKLGLVIKEEAKKYRDFYEKILPIPEDKKTIYQKSFETIKFENLAPLFKKSLIGAEIFFKKKGIGVAIAIMLGKAVKFSLIYLTVQLQMPHLTPFIMSIPWSAISSNVPVMLQKRKINQKIAESLGGNDAYKAYRAQEEFFIKNLKIMNVEDFLIPLDINAEHQTIAVKINYSTIFKKIMGILKIDQKNLNLSTLKTFIKENNIESQYYQWILKNRKITDDMKLTLIITDMYESDLDHFSKLKLKFSKHFITFSQNFNWDEIFQWTKEMQSKKTIAEIREGIKNIPSKITPRELGYIWTDVLAPYYIENLNMSYEEARNLVLEVESYRARLTMINTNELDNEVDELTDHFLKKVFGNLTSTCHRSPKTVLKILQTK